MLAYMHVYVLTAVTIFFLLSNLSQRGFYKVWEIDMGVCPRLEFDNIVFIHCLGYDFYIYGAFDFYAIPLLIYDVMYDITTIP